MIYPNPKTTFYGKSLRAWTAMFAYIQVAFSFGILLTVCYVSFLSVTLDEKDFEIHITGYIENQEQLLFWCEVLTVNCFFGIIFGLMLHYGTLTEWDQNGNNVILLHAWGFYIAGCWIFNCGIILMYGSVELAIQFTFIFVILLWFPLKILHLFVKERYQEILIRQWESGHERERAMLSKLQFSRREYEDQVHYCMEDENSVVHNPTSLI